MQQMYKTDPRGLNLKKISGKFIKGKALFANNGHGVLVIHNAGKKMAHLKVMRQPDPVKIKVAAGEVLVAGKFAPAIFNKGTGQLCVVCDTAKNINIALIY